MQQHQPHEPFFSFTVPPKPTLLHQQHSPNLSSLHSSHHPNSHLLSSIVTDLDSHRTYPDLSLRSPSSASPSGNSSANRPGTAGPFAFNVPSATPSTTPSSSVTRLSPIHPPTTASSLAPSLDRPFSSSGLPLTSTVPPSHNNTQASSPSHAITHEPHTFDARSSFPNISSSQSRSAHPSSLPAPAHMSHCAINLHHSRPMTAPGSAWVGSHHGDGLDIASAHAGLFGQAPPYPLQPTSLSAATLSKTASADFSSSIRHATHSSPGPSSAHTVAVDPITQAPHGSSSGSSDPDSILHDYAGQSASPVRVDSVTGRPSLGTHSTESTPESPESSDADNSQNLPYINPMPPNNLYHTLRPNTHSGACNLFGNGDRFISQPLHPRPATGYPQVYDSNGGYSSIHPQSHIYGPRTPMFPTHSSQIYAAGSAGQYSHGPGSFESHGQDRLYNFNILPGAPRKRARRRFDEVERLYDCNYPGCTKAYGTLNHLNAHISMQKHGPKRLPQEFKEIRKEWRARKKAEAEARASALKQPANNTGTSHEYNVLSRQESFRPHNVGVRIDSSPSGSSTSGGFAHMRPSTVGGSHSAPAHSQQFTLSDRQVEWFNDRRLNGTTIDEHPEYLADQQPGSHLIPLPPNQTAPPLLNGAAANSFQEQGLIHHHRGLAASHMNPLHRAGQILVNHHSSSVVDHT